MNIFILSLLAVAQEQKEFNHNDYSTWTEQNIQNADFSQVPKQQLDRADPKIVEKASIEQAKQYFRSRWPITAESQNELILYQKIYPNVDTDSFKNVDRVKLGEGYIETPTSNVNFGQSDVKIGYSNGVLKVGDIEVLTGSITIKDKNHIILGPRTLISTPNLRALGVKETTDFFTRGNSCTGTRSCIESDVQNRYLKGIAMNGNQINILANDYKAYDKIQLFKDTSSKLVLQEGQGLLGGRSFREVIFRENADGPVGRGILPFSTDVEIGIIDGTVGIITKDGQIKKSDTSVGKAFAGGALNERLSRLPADFTISIPPNTNVIEAYRTTGNFEVYKTDKNDIIIIDAQTQTVFYRQEDSVWYGIPKRGEPQKLVPRPGSLTEKTIKEAESGRPSNVVPQGDVPTLNQPGIRHRCPPRTRCG